MKADCPNFRLFVNNVQIGNYSTRADLHNALLTLNVYDSEREWKESGLNRAWCDGNGIEKLLDDCFVWTDKTILK